MGDCPFPLGPVIGRGGQAFVHASTDPFSGRPIAVKVQHSGSRRAAIGLRREYQILRELEHPAFAAAHGAGTLPDGRTWLAMDYVDGVSATDWARTLGPVGTAHRGLRVLARTVELADAVAHLHAAGLVHGDLKPGNVLVAPDGGLHVIDLGGAHLDTTRSGRGFFHTPSYAAPEQLEHQAVAASADVFSLAVTAYRLLTDELPFGSGTRAAVRERQSQGVTLDLAGPLPEAARAVLERALAVDPTARFPTAAAFRDALREALPAAPAWSIDEPAAALQPRAVRHLRQQLLDAPGHAALVVVGPLGSGKSALLRQLAADARALGARVVSGRGGDAAALVAAVAGAVDELAAADAGELPQLVVTVAHGDHLGLQAEGAISQALDTYAARGGRALFAPSSSPAGLEKVARAQGRPAVIRTDLVQPSELRALFPGADARELTAAAAASGGRARHLCALAAGEPIAGPHRPIDAAHEAVLAATALATAGDDELDPATLGAALGAPPATMRRRLDRLVRLGWLTESPLASWSLRGPERAAALGDGAEPTTDEARSRADARGRLAARLADEWEGDPLTPGRASCLVHAGRGAAAADVAGRWARRALSEGRIGEVARALDDLASLDRQLGPGPTRTSWLLLRARVGALADCTDPRVDGWLERVAESGRETPDARRATELAHLVAIWRGEGSQRHRTLHIAQRELDADRYDGALSLAAAELRLAEESGDLLGAALAARIASGALVALGRLGEAARALADADGYWPEQAGVGLVAAERAEVLGLLGRWGEASRVIARAAARAVTPWDRAALAIAAAGRATDRGHARHALMTLEPLSTLPAVQDHERLVVSWHVERLRALTVLGRPAEAAQAAREADRTVAALINLGRRGAAARLGLWQGAALWIGEHGEDAATLCGEAVAVLSELGHRPWWCEAATLATWIARATSPESRTRLPEPLARFIADAEAWPLAMRAALAEGDVARAWDAATTFLALTDTTSMTALELAPWALRAQVAAAPTPPAEET